MEQNDFSFVRADALVPGLVTELRYATPDNFTGQVIYDFQSAWLRCGTAKKLSRAQALLRPHGLGLKLWDAFRPPEAQFRLWEIMPDDDYVADPRTGFSKHSRGNAVDVTLVTLNGVPVEMPTSFDDFSGAARRDAPVPSPAAAAHSALLEKVMTQAGFQSYIGEWWHFVDTEQYPVETSFIPHS